MNAQSIWRGTATTDERPRLENDLLADVVVVGGGITGTTLARRLAAAGTAVVLLEAGRIGGAATAGSTGNLYATLSGGLQPVAEKWSDEVARAVVDSRRHAIGAIEREIDALQIDHARFVRCPLYRYGSTESLPDGTPTQERIEREFIATQQAGLQARLEKAVPAGLPQPHGPVLVIDDQAQFHPLAYVQALADRAASDGCLVFENSPVVEIDVEKGVVRGERACVRAREIVLATHTPSGFHKVQIGLQPKREYGVAFPIERDALPAGVYWDVGEPLSVRTLDAGDEHLLICVGQAWPSGQHDASQALASLEALAARRFDVPAIAYRWSAQNFRSPDLLPYIGRDGSDALIATGFATDGLVFGTLAAMIIADTILDQANRWSELYRADRFTPVKSAGSVLGETAQVVKAAFKDYVTDRQAAELRALAPRQGAIVEVDDERIAAYRDASGEIFAVSATCTHMGCMVHWNEFETSWDCPCHGSRFAVDGRVIEGPALAPLERRRLRDAE